MDGVGLQIGVQGRHYPQSQLYVEAGQRCLPSLYPCVRPLVVINEAMRTQVLKITPQSGKILAGNRGQPSMEALPNEPPLQMPGREVGPRRRRARIEGAHP